MVLEASTIVVDANESPPDATINIIDLLAKCKQGNKFRRVKHDRICSPKSVFISNDQPPRLCYDKPTSYWQKLFLRKSDQLKSGTCIDKIFNR